MDQQSIMPSSVRHAVHLLWIAMAIGLAYITYQLLQSSTSTSFLAFPVGAIVLLFLAAFMAFMVWLTISLRRGRNWARITFLGLFAVGLPSWIGGLKSHAQVSLVGTLIAVVIALCQIAALVLLFVPSARRWFKRSASPSNGLA
jgi:hypothetical protein